MVFIFIWLVSTVFIFIILVIWRGKKTNFSKVKFLLHKKANQDIVDTRSYGLGEKLFVIQPVRRLDSNASKQRKWAVSTSFKRVVFFL